MHAFLDFALHFEPFLQHFQVGLLDAKVEKGIKSEKKKLYNLNKHTEFLFFSLHKY